MYLSEESHFTDFDNPDKLIWHQKGLKYGTWTDGPDKDGSRTLKTVIEASEVRTISLIIFLYDANLDYFILGCLQGFCLDFGLRR